MVSLSTRPMLEAIIIILWCYFCTGMSGTIFNPSSLNWSSRVLAVAHIKFSNDLGFFGHLFQIYHDLSTFTKQSSSHTIFQEGSNMFRGFSEFVALLCTQHICQDKPTIHPRHLMTLRLTPRPHVQGQHRRWTSVNVLRPYRHWFPTFGLSYFLV